MLQSYSPVVTLHTPVKKKKKETKNNIYDKSAREVFKII